EGNGEEVEREGNRLTVKIPAGENVALWCIEHGTGGTIADRPWSSEYERIVHCGVDLRLHHLAAVGKSVTHGAVHLWHAAQRVGILNLVAMAMGLANFAAFDELAKVGRGPQLARMGPRFVNAFIKGDIGAAQHVQGEGADHVRRFNQYFRCLQGEGSYRQHALR